MSAPAGYYEDDQGNWREAVPDNDDPAPPVTPDAVGRLSQLEREQVWAVEGSRPALVEAVERILTRRLAAHTDDLRAEVWEALEACREQRTDLLELLEAEREQHAEALRTAWHEGYGAGSSDATDGWLKPGSARTPNPYLAHSSGDPQ